MPVFASSASDASTVRVSVIRHPSISISISISIDTLQLERILFHVHY